MFPSLRSLLADWHASTGERQKLQHTLLVIAVIMVFVAGLVSLVEPELGHDLVRVGLLAVVVFLVNAVVWNLLYSSLLLKLEPKPKRPINRKQNDK